MTKLFVNAAILFCLASPAVAGETMEIRWQSTIIGQKYALILQDSNNRPIGHYMVEITADATDTIDPRGAARICIDPFEGSNPIIQVTAQGTGVATYVMQADPQTGLFCPEGDLRRISVMAR